MASMPVSLNPRAPDVLQGATNWFQSPIDLGTLNLPVHICYWLAIKWINQSLPLRCCICHFDPWMPPRVLFFLSPRHIQHHRWGQFPPTPMPSIKSLTWPLFPCTTRAILKVRPYFSPLLLFIRLSPICIFCLCCNIGIQIFLEQQMEESHLPHTPRII